MIGITIPFLFLEGCYKKDEQADIEPFRGRIVGEEYAEGYDSFGSANKRYSWSIVVNPSTLGENPFKDNSTKSFNYSVVGNDTDKSVVNLKSLDNAFNKGDLVTIRKYKNGFYSYPE